MARSTCLTLPASLFLCFTLSPSPFPSLTHTHVYAHTKTIFHLCFFLFSFHGSHIDGQLRHLKTGEPFVFNAREDLHRWNQKRYEALGEVRHCSFCWHTFLLPSGHPYSALSVLATGSSCSVLTGFSKLTLQAASQVANIADCLESKRITHQRITCQLRIKSAKLLYYSHIRLRIFLTFKYTAVPP